MTAQKLWEEIVELRKRLEPGQTAYLRDIERIRKALKASQELIESEWGPMAYLEAAGPDVGDGDNMP